MTTEASKKAQTIMVLGTSSDVGKSIITTGLCRIFLEDGWKVAPFKSQNMSNNSYVTIDGKEIGRAQGVQADACQIQATTDMNPILLKPKGDMTSQTIVHGVPVADFNARDYREDYLPQAEHIVKESLARLREQYDVVVMEGAGSPAEVNLKDRDIVNMRAAEWGEAPAVLVADIDRGGVFASIIGTLEILTEEERARVQGFIINKFRGDVSLLKPGLDWLEERTGKPVLGVVPYLPILGIEDEDSASLDSKRNSTRNRTKDSSYKPLDIAVIRFPRISNFTDIDPLYDEEDVQVRYISHPGEWGNPDAIIVPGSKNTTEDLRHLRSTGMQKLLLEYMFEQGGHVVGICGGYQMLGRKLLDPDKLESNETEYFGLGVFPTITTFEQTKKTVRITGTSTLYSNEPKSIDGYEIHMGQTYFEEEVNQPFVIDGLPEGASVDGGRIWGTYIHGILHNDDLRRQWLNYLRLSKGLEPLDATLRFREKRENAFDRLALELRKHLDLKRIYTMIGLSNPS